jgi:hypothetical protein
MERQENEDVNPPREASDGPSIAQVFLKIISAQIEVKEDETKFSKQIQDSELTVQVKYNMSFKTKPAAGSLIPQWHTGFTFAVLDLNTQIKVKLISTKRLINTTLGKIAIPLETLYEAPKVVEMPLESVNKKLQGVKLCMVMMCIREDAKGLAKRYSVVSNVMKLKRFKHLNSPYYTQKGIVAIHPKFKIVLERPNYFPGEIVRGAVIYDLTKTVDHISYIKIYATGTEASTWTEGSGSNAVTYSDARQIFSLLQYAVCTPDRDGVTMFAGMHVYPFEVQLPSVLPSSIGSDGSSMTYLIHAEVASLKNWRVNKSASAFFNVYGTETKFRPPLVITDPPGYIKKHLKDDWTGDVILSSQKQYPHNEYGMTIRFHNPKRIAVKQIKVSIKCVKQLRIQSKFQRSNFYMWSLLRGTVPTNDTKEEDVQVDFRYTLPTVQPTVAPIDDVQLFQYHTFAKVSLTLANLTKRHRVVPITVGTIIPEDFAREPHVINPDARATMTVYHAKRPMVHGLVAYKSTSIQFFDEKIFSSYHAADLVRIENLLDASLENNTPLVNNNNTIEDEPVRNKYVDIDEDELPDSDESKSM